MSRLGESLQISKVEKEDEGVYTCLALSQIGNSHAKAKLTVIGKNVFVLILQLLNTLRTVNVPVHVGIQR